MKILYAASEALPFAASGGLADVVGALPKAMVQQECDCRIVLPLYRSVKPAVRNQMTFLKDFTVEIGWRKQYCGIYTIQRNGVIYDCERFIFFSRAVLELLSEVEFFPDFIHCNDWQTAMIPVYYDIFYKYRQGYEKIKTIYTIHNIQYQGVYGKEVITELMGIPTYYTNLLEYDGCVNLMKGAIETADCVTTVSPTYAKEILDPWFSYGMDRELVRRQDGVRGILNGIDVDLYNPETDPDIKEHYSVSSRTGKKACKTDLLEEMKWEDNGMPVIGIVTRFVAHKGIHLIQYAFQEMLELG